MRHGGAVCLLAVILAACAEAEVHATRPTEPEATPSSTTSAAATSLPSGSTTSAAAADGVLVVDGYTYSLGAADGCYQLEVSAGDLDPVVEQRCPSPGYWYTIFSQCADPPADAEPGDGETSVTTAPCLRRLPTVLYGYLPEDIGYLCLPSAGDQPGEFGPVTLIERSPSGLFLEALPGFHTTPFPYTASGTHWGEPPLDAPSRVIYSQCDAAGPWGEAAVEIPLQVLVEIDPALAQAGQAVSLDPGNGGAAFDLAIFAPSNRGMVDLSLPAGETELRVGWGATGWAPDTLGSFQLPAEIIAEGASGWICPDAPVLWTTLTPGDPVTVRLDWLTSVAAYARLGLEGVPTGRTPGQPCPDGGARATTATTLHFTSAYDGYYRFDVAPEVGALGPEWGLLVRTLDMGLGLDLAHLAAAPGERYWGYLFPGTVLTVGIERPEAAEPGEGSVAVLIPEIPPGLDGPYLLVVAVTGYSTGDGRPVLLSEDVTLHWEQDEH